MRKPIGGYFEIEKTGKGGDFPLSDGVLLNSGRNALEYILSSIGYVRLVYVPTFTCSVILEPLEKLNIEYRTYSINADLELSDNISLYSDEYLLYTNYFGLKDEYVKTLSCKFGSSLIVDNAQALFAEPIPNIKTLYSPRKYVGIPDGGVAYCSKGLNIQDYPYDDSSERMDHLYLRLNKGPEAGYAAFKNNNKKLVMQPVKRMSTDTMSIIDHIDFAEIKNIRWRNFRKLHEALKHTNILHIPDNDSFECPMVYPYWTTDKGMKSKLIEEQVFVATYWPNVLESVPSVSIEYRLTNEIIALPIDQRYGDDEMDRIIQLICK